VNGETRLRRDPEQPFQAPGDKYYEQFIDVIPNNPSKTVGDDYDGDDLDTCDRLAVDIVPSNLEADGFIPGGGQACLEEVWPNPKGHRWDKPASSTPRPPIQCNMMPFVIGDLSSIPEVYRVYQDVVNCFFPGLFFCTVLQRYESHTSCLQ
jgi:hypothetical protein